MMQVNDTDNPVGEDVIKCPKCGAIGNILKNIRLMRYCQACPDGTFYDHKGQIYEYDAAGNLRKVTGLSVVQKPSKDVLEGLSLSEITKVFGTTLTIAKTWLVEYGIYEPKNVKAFVKKDDKEATEDMTLTEKPSKAELESLIQKFNGSINSIAKDKKVSWGSVRKWLIEDELMETARNTSAAFSGKPVPKVPNEPQAIAQTVASSEQENPGPNKPETNSEQNPEATGQQEAKELTIESDDQEPQLVETNQQTEKHEPDPTIPSCNCGCNCSKTITPEPYFAELTVLEAIQTQDELRKELQCTGILLGRSGFQWAPATKAVLEEHQQACRDKLAQIKDQFELVKIRIS
ncbi:MAG: hypothetical protein WA118_08210 [Carboxydocellales bacterium]